MKRIFLLVLIAFAVTSVSATHYSNKYICTDGTVSLTDSTFTWPCSLSTRLYKSILKSSTGYSGIDIYNETNKYFSANILGASYAADSLKGRAYLGTNADQMLFTSGNNYKWSFNPQGTTTAMRLTSAGLFVNGAINASSMSSGPVIAVDTVKPYTLGNMLFLKDSVTIWTLDNLGATNDVKQWADCGHIMSFEGGIRVGATRRNEGYNGPAIKVDYNAVLGNTFSNVILSLYPGISSIVASNQVGGPDSAAFVVYGGVDINGKAGLGAYGADTTQGLWAGTDRITSWEPHYFKQGLYGHLYGLADTASTLQGKDTTWVITMRVTNPDSLHSNPWTSYLRSDISDTALGKLWMNDTLRMATGKPVMFGAVAVKDSLNEFRVKAINTDTAIVNGMVGIGTAAPGRQLEVKSDNGGMVRLMRNDVAVTVGEVLGTYEFYSNDASTGGTNIMAEISAVGGSQGSGRDADLVFKTRFDPNVSGDGYLERLRITKTGTDSSVFTSKRKVSIADTIKGLKRVVAGSAYMDSATGMVYAVRCSVSGKVALAKDTVYYGVLTSRSPADFNVGDCPGDTVMTVRRTIGKKTEIVIWLDKDGVWHRANGQVAMAENNVVVPGKNNTVIIIMLVLLALSNMGLWVIKMKRE